MTSALTTSGKGETAPLFFSIVPTQGPHSNSPSSCGTRKSKRRKGHIDAAAACVILEDFLRERE